MSQEAYAFPANIVEYKEKELEAWHCKSVKGMPYSYAQECVSYVITSRNATTYLVISIHVKLPQSPCS